MPTTWLPAPAPTAPARSTAQCNPHIVPFISLRRALPRTLGRLVEMELKHL